MTTSMFTRQDVEDERALAFTLGGLGERLGDHPIAASFAEMAVRCAERAEKIETLLKELTPENDHG